VALRQLIRKESLTESEASRLFAGIDKRLFLQHLVSLLKYKHFLTDEEILGMFSTKASGQELPLSLLANKGLSALEAICRYLKEEKGYRYSEIARLLNRDQRTIWVTYHNSVKKRKEPLSLPESGYTFPLTIFQDRNLSVLEALVRHLKDTYHLRYTDIAQLINRDERNIWGIYSKAEKKLRAS